MTGSIGLSLIELVCDLISFRGCGVDLELGEESRHIGQLGRACQITRLFIESILTGFNFMLNLSLGFVPFHEKPEFAECTRRLA